MPSLNDDDDMDKWPACRNPALLAGAELVQNDKQAFIPPLLASMIALTATQNMWVYVWLSLWVFALQGKLTILFFLWKKKTWNWLLT